MIRNNDITTFQRLDNGHFLLMIAESSRCKLSLYAFNKNIKCTNALYMDNGYLELHDLESLMLFLDVNKRHLSVEVSRSILDDALKSTLEKNTNYSKTLSIFQQTGEKIPLARLEAIKAWSEKYYNPKKYVDNVLLNVCPTIFEVLLPRDKRKLVGGGPFKEVFEENGNILFEPAKTAIGNVYKEFNQFVIACGKVADCSTAYLPKIARSPGNLGGNWKILTSELNFDALPNWLASVMDSGMNPIFNEPFDETDIAKLKKYVVILEVAVQELKIIEAPSLKI